jgi:hypothetical protein
MTRFGVGHHLVQTVEGILQGTTRSCKQKLVPFNDQVRCWPASCANR